MRYVIQRHRRFSVQPAVRKTDAEAKLGELRRGSPMQATRAFTFILIGLLLLIDCNKQTEAQAKFVDTQKALDLNKYNTKNKSGSQKSNKIVSIHSDINEELIYLLAYRPHLLNSSRLAEMHAKLQKENTYPGKTKNSLQIIALMLFSVGDFNKFSEIHHKAKELTKGNASEERMLEKMMESATEYLNANFERSERALYSSVEIFLGSEFADDIERLAYGKILMRIMPMYIDREWINSLREKLINKALEDHHNSCEEENSLALQLRDTLIDRTQYLDSINEKKRTLSTLPKIKNKCKYNEILVSAQDATVKALIEANKEEITYDRLESLLANAAYKILRISIIEDPNAISMKALVNANSLLLANSPVSGDYLSHLIVTDDKAEKLFMELKANDISSARNKSAIARKAVEITHDSDKEYSEENKIKAIRLAQEAFQELVNAGASQRLNTDIAWEMTDYVVSMSLYLDKKELEKSTDAIAEYISEVKQPPIIKAVLIDTIYMGYIASRNYLKAIKYGSWMQDLHIKGWRTSGLGLPNTGDAISPEMLEYTARVSTHAWLLQRLVHATPKPSRFLYEKAMSLLLKDVLNLKGISIDLLKRKRIAINSGGFSEEEKQIIDKGEADFAKRPFANKNMIAKLRNRLIHVKLREAMERNNSYPKKISIDQIKSRMGSKETLVEYIKLLDEYFIITLQSDGEIFVTTAGEKEEVDSLINQLIDGIASKNISQTEKTASILANRIFSPIHEELVSSEVIYISPDSSLNKIPFHLLTDKYSKNTGKILNLRLVTSGRDLINLKTEEKDLATTESIVIANPDFNYAEGNNQLLDRSEKKKWSSLPGTQKEGKIIASLLNTSYVGEQKARKKFIKSLSSPKVLHIATHAFYNAETGDSLNNSGMVFAGANVLPAKDSILSPEEISVLDLNSTALTVLSACETGIGEVLEGGSMASIQRAFTIAGTRSVINTLWKVDDYSSMAFMKEFYGYLIQGKSLEEAMKHTRNYFKNHPIPGWRAPYYWAAFQLYGDWRPIFR